jgi:CHAD domain-containing protein
MADRPLQALVSPEHTVQQCRDIFVRQLGCAIEELSERKPNFHGARKQLKRARATLRLLRPAVGDESYRDENIAARDAARPLSKARDDEALNKTLETLSEQFGTTISRAHVRQTAHEVSPRQLTDIKAALKRSMTHAQAWQPDAADWDPIATGLRATYRRGRRAMRAARKDRATDDLHEWRKQTKYLWHQLQILTPLAPGAVGEMADEFHHLADYLGDEHDLAVLRERLSASATPLLIEKRSEELQDRAFALGERLYADKPKAFLSVLEKHWTQWQRQQRRDT